MNSRITAGIVGYGLIGRTHAQALLGVDEALLTGIVSRRGRTLSAETGGPDFTGVRQYKTPKAMYADSVPDVVAICTPSGGHGEQSRAALEHGAHVLVEKPPASTVAELRALISLALSRDRHLAVVSQQRLEPQLEHVAAVIRDGRLGAPLIGELHLHWHRPQRYYDDAPWRATDSHGGSLGNQGWHAVDLLTWFLGPAATVTGQTFTLAHKIDVEDAAAATIQFRCGAMGSIVTTTATPPGEPAEIRLFFERGSVRIRDTQVAEWSVPDDVPPPPSTGNAASGASDPAAIGAIGHQRQWQDLVDAIHSGKKPSVTAADSIHTLALIEAIYDSARSGNAVSIGGDDA